MSLIVCALLVSYYFYYAFLRLRVFKIIPFELTDLRLCLLVYLCITYLYIIFRLLKPKNPPEFLINLLQVVSKPFTFLDLEIKYKLLKNYYAKFFLFIVPLLDDLTPNQCKIIYYCFNIIPRGFLVLLFILDVFYFNKLEIFYYFIFLGIFPLIYTYILYSLNLFYEGYLKYLEARYVDVRLLEKGNNYPGYWAQWPHKTPQEEEEYNEVHSPLAVYHDKIVTLREYIKIQYAVFIAWDEHEKDTRYEYEGYAYATELYYTQYKKKTEKTFLDTEDYEIIKTDFNLFMPKLVVLYTFIELNKLTQSQKIFVNIKVFIYSLYFVCWVYIIYLSYLTINDFSFTLALLNILSFYSKVIEPFSDMFL
jgi:hypothetical protein